MINLNKLLRNILLKLKNKLNGISFVVKWVLLPLLISSICLFTITFEFENSRFQLYFVMSNNTILYVICSILLMSYYSFILYLTKKEFTSKESLQVLKVEYSKNLRCLKFNLHNEYLLEGKELAEAIFNCLMNNKRFIKFCHTKVILVNGVNVEMNLKFNFHHNILINNDTTFEEYYNKVSNIINHHYENGEHGYLSTVVNQLTVLVWDMDNYRNKNKNY